MRVTKREHKIELILFYLNRNEVRATYGAVAEVLQIPAQSAGRYLGSSRPYASWVVAKGTGTPSGYTKNNYHQRLFSNEMIIDSGAELMRIIPLQ